MTVYIGGVITPGQVKAISNFLGEPYEFSPKKVGLPNPNGVDGDQMLCRLDMDSLVPCVEDPTVSVTMCDLVGKFKALRT